MQSPKTLDFRVFYGTKTPLYFLMASRLSMVFAPKEVWVVVPINPGLGYCLTGSIGCVWKSKLRAPPVCVGPERDEKLTDSVKKLKASLISLVVVVRG